MTKIYIISPCLREGYKYLGLIQTDRDTLRNIERVQQIFNEKVEPILRSELSPAQKIHMLNTTIIPAILYVMGNVYLRESRASTLAKCTENAPALSFPAYQSIYAEDWILSLSHSAGEEQVHGLGSNPATRRCRLGYNADENAYHVSSSCLTPAYNDRHDRVVYFALQNILMGMGAPEHILLQLRFGKVAVVSEYTWGPINFPPGKHHGARRN